MSTTLFENMKGAGVTAEERLAFLAGAFLGDMLGMLDPWMGVIRETTAGEIQATGLDAPPVYADHSGVGTIPTVAASKGYTYTFTKHIVAQAVAFDYATFLTLPLVRKLEYQQQFGNGGIQAFVQACYDLLNDGDSVNGPDAVPLYSSAHPSRVGNQSNVVASVLDEDAIALAEQLMESFQGTDGQKHIVRLDHLEVPTALKHTAKRAVGPGLSQPERASGAYATINPVADSGITYQSSPFLDSATKAFGMAKAQSTFEAAILSGFMPEWEKLNGGYDQILKDMGIFFTGRRGWRHTVLIGS